MTQDQDKTILDFAQTLLDKLEITAKVVVSDQDGAKLVTIETEESGVLIGRHGRSLEALQILLGQLVYKKLGEWVRIVVTVGDYRERRQKQIEEMALNAAERVMATQTPIEFTDMTPAERRIIHMTLADHPQVVSESTGEGRDRKLTVKLKE